ncbi:MAG: MATE family efflux transporter [Lachnospira sp.]|nr:MATE family efflux transporter [Lachnospira sp.]
MVRDMTKGKITAHMLLYTVPLMIGNFFHLLYNTVDTVIVGQINGKQALAAIGAAGPVMNILLFLLVGISLGSSILMSHNFGARDYDQLKKQFVTTLMGTVYFTIVISVVSFILCRNILVWTRTPEAIISQAEGYLKIIIAGLIFSGVYNILSGALRSIGNAMAPLIILIISSIMNIVLDLLFVGQWGMGINGAAYATVISQFFSALLGFLYIIWKVPYFKCGIRELKLDVRLLKKTISFSSVSAFQQTVLYVGRILVQSAVNMISVDAVAAFNISTIIDNYVLEPGNSLASSLMIFTSQNMGAGRKERIAKGYRTVLVMGLVFNFVIAVVVFFFCKPLIGIFMGNADEGVVTEGMRYLQTMSMGYILCVFCNTFQGFFRGIGDLKVTLIATTIQIPIRVFISYAMVGQLGIKAIPLGIIVGWIFMIGFEGWQYVRRRKTFYLRR